MAARLIATCLLSACLTAACLIAGGPTGAAPVSAPISTPAAGEARRTPPRTIVAVLGSPDDGFIVRRFDGSVEFPPTWSEAMAECAELHRLVLRVRCRTFVRVRYGDLTGFKRSIRWARSAR